MRRMNGYLRVHSQVFTNTTHTEQSEQSYLRVGSRTFRNGFYFVELLGCESYGMTGAV